MWQDDPSKLALLFESLPCHDSLALLSPCLVPLGLCKWLASSPVAIAAGFPGMVVFPGKVIVLLKMTVGFGKNKAVAARSLRG